jgi:hypothetical protein
MKIETFDRSACRLLRDRIEEVLSEVAIPLGIHLEVGRISFYPENATVKLTASVIRKGKVASREANNFTSHAKLFGLNPKWLNQEFTSFDGAKYVIVGCRPRSRKYPILAKSVTNGRNYKFAPESIRRYMTEAE